MAESCDSIQDDILCVMSRGVWVVSAFALTAALYHSLFNDPSRVGAILEREMEEIKEQQQKLVQAKESPSSRAEGSFDYILIFIIPSLRRSTCNLDHDSLHIDARQCNP